MADIRAQLADCTLHELIDIAGGVLHLLGVRARLTHNRWSALASVLRRHGIDPESPTASSDLDHLLRRVPNVTP